MSGKEEKTACIALLTRAAWTEDLPAPLTRRMYHRLKTCGALQGLKLHREAADDAQLFERASQLLSTAAVAARCLDEIEAQGYRMLLPDDAFWPQKLRLLGGQMPPFLFLRGNLALLSERRIAVAGSRDMLKQTACAAAQTGYRLAHDGFVMVCGGARGADDQAQRALLDAGGNLILVPALPAGELLDRHGYLRDALERGRLLVVCDALPDEPFSAAKALARNHTIYALGEAAIVVAARNGVGGSWRGATDCLRGGYTPVYALDAQSADMQGNKALHALGAGKLDVNKELDGQLRDAMLKQLDMFSGCCGEGILCR